nr:polysaccharide pyruvyl transferase family protein [Anaerobacillus isosaccharinicus]QOY38683.1 polysaccharide pyruvyl transferase family protein [Anaerobacillus isosaccharinicus]
MEEIMSNLEILKSVIPKKAKVIYLEYPIFANVGDLLIMKGTEEFFKIHELQVIGRYTKNNFNYTKEIPEDCIILCHGGGNFGDLYSVHQLNREKIIESYPDHKIVVLPQTIYFENNEHLNRAKQIFNQHNNLHVFTRDKRSYEFAKEYFTVNIYLSPDMAHFLWPLSYSSEIKNNVLYFLRTDQEANNGLQRMQFCEKSLDWGSMLTLTEKALIKIIAAFGKLDKLLNNVLPIAAIWKKYSDYLISKSFKVFSEHEKIVTSRLHGHIMACLLNKENLLLDNSYGKNSEYFKAWTYRVTNSDLIQIDDQQEKLESSQ